MAADRGLSGFSPGIRKILLAAGVDLSMPSTGASTVWGQNLAPSRAEQAASPYYQILNSTGVAPVGFLNDPNNPGIQAAQQRAHAGKPLDPGVQKLLDQLTRARQIESDRGAPSQEHKPGFLSRALGYLGRPLQAVEGGIQAMQEASARSPENTIGERLSVLGAFGGGAKRGFTGQEHTSGQELLAAAGPPPKVLQGLGPFGGLLTQESAHRPGTAGNALGGLALDVAFDPLTYVTFGLGSGVSKAGRVAGEKATEKAARDAVAAGASQSVPEIMADLGVVRTKVPFTPRARSAMAAEGARTIDQVAADVGFQAMRDAAAQGADRAAQVAARTGAQDATTRQLTELMASNLAQRLTKSVKVKVAGLPVASVPVPPPVLHAVDAVGRTNLAAKAIDVFGKTFNTGSRFDSELTATKARTAGLAERRIELMRDQLRTDFAGLNPDQRKSIMEAVATTPRGFGAGVVTLKDGRDAADVVRDTFDHMGRYIDWGGNGNGVLELDDVQRYLPKRFQFDKTALANPGSPAENVAALVARNAEHLRSQDAGQFLYALHIATEKALARDQLARAVAVFGVPAGGKAAQVPLWSKAGQELQKHGYAPIVARGRDKVVSGAYARHFEGLVFDPEVRKGITRLLAVADDVNQRGELIRSYDKIMSGFKKALTLPNPSYHLRNSFGDVFLGYLDDVSGPRGMASYEQASRTMRAMNSLGKQPNIRDILYGAVDPVTGVAQDPVEALAKVAAAGKRGPGPGRRVMATPKKWSDAPGGYLSAEQIWAAYNQAGLKRGFVAADLGDEMGQGLIKGRPIGKASDALMNVSQQREDYFRLSHFIDRLKRSNAPTLAKAADEAASYVRRYHFDYHDVTPTEQRVFARLFPFYKFQRFAAPLMVQMFFAKPGKIVNAQKALYSISDAAGFPRDDSGLPTANEILPDYFRDAFMIPLMHSAQGNTIYANPGLPSTQVLGQTLGLTGATPGAVAKAAGMNVVTSSNPLIQMPYELASGHRIFGGGQVPVGPLPEYFASKTPITNLAFVGAGKQDAKTRVASWLSGLGLQEDTPSRQRGALLDELQRISAQRKKDNFTAPRKAGPGRSGRSSRSGR
jgi:hypothetical protein